MELHKLGRKLYEFTDHLGNTLAITLDKKKGFGNDGGYYVGYYPELLALNDYYPFGMLMPDRNPAAGNGYRFGFNGQEKTDEVYGKGNLNTALFWEYDTRIGRRWNVDPKAADAPDWTPYRFGFNNPIRYTDPDGRWEWDAVGNLKVQKGDNSYTLAKFLGTNQNNAMTILNRGGVTANDKGILNLKSGQVFSKYDLWVAFKSGSGAVVKNSKEAVSHYFDGKGASADVGDQATRELLSSSKFREKHAKITSEAVDPEGCFSVDLTKTTFHIGRTNVDYSVSGNGKSSSVTYTLFSRDGFWDPDFIDENTLGKIPIIRDWTNTKPDGPGPNLERFGGTPYHYITRERTYFFKPVEDN
jgi:RHS repeat-associated protein